MNSQGWTGFHHHHPSYLFLDILKPRVGVYSLPFWVIFFHQLTFSTHNCFSILGVICDCWPWMGKVTSYLYYAFLFWCQSVSEVKIILFLWIGTKAGRIFWWWIAVSLVGRHLSGLYLISLLLFNKSPWILVCKGIFPCVLYTLLWFGDIVFLRFGIK